MNLYWPSVCSLDCQSIHIKYQLKLSIKNPPHIFFQCVHTEAAFDTNIIQIVKNVP